MPAILNGYYSIQSPQGEHRTFRISTQKTTAKFAPGERILGILSGPNNRSDYRGFAFVQDKDGKVELRVWRKHCGTKLDTMGRMLLQLLLQPEGQLARMGYKLNRDATCLRCNRPLTTPASVKLGVGPECAEIMGLEFPKEEETKGGCEHGEDDSDGAQVTPGGVHGDGELPQMVNPIPHGPDGRGQVACGGGGGLLADGCHSLAPAESLA